MKYAAETKVPAAQSRAEIEKTLTRYGADGFMYGWDGPRAMVAFRARGRMVRFWLPMPHRESAEVVLTKDGRARSESSAQAAYEQAVRQRWRALLLAIKAKLEAVESEIVSFEDEFMAHIVLPDGTTVAEFMAPQIEQSYESGKMPSMLPQLEAG